MMLVSVQSDIPFLDFKTKHQNYQPVGLTLRYSMLHSIFINGNCHLICSSIIMLYHEVHLLGSSAMIFHKISVLMMIF